MDEWANSWGNNSQKRFIDIGCSCESLHVISEFFAFGILISIYTVTNPPSHKCENYSEPNQLREDLDSEKYFSKYQQLMILSVDLKIIVLSSLGNALFSFSFFKLYICLNVVSEEEFFSQKVWTPKIQWRPIDMKNKFKKHPWNISSLSSRKVEKDSLRLRTLTSNPILNAHDHFLRQTPRHVASQSWSPWKQAIQNQLLTPLEI